MPPTPDGQLKFNRDLPFLHTVQHSESGDEFSVPIVDYNHTQWTSADKIPHSLVEEIDIVIKGIYGPEAAKDLKPHTYRLCWQVPFTSEPLKPGQLLIIFLQGRINERREFLYHTSHQLLQPFHCRCRIMARI